MVDFCNSCWRIYCYQIPLSVVLLPKPISALKPDRIGDIAAQVVASHGVVARDLNRDIIELDASAWASTTALDFAEDSAGRGTSPISYSDVADVELAGVAFARGLVVAGALCDRKNARCIVELEVGHGDVGCVAKASTTSVWWVATADTRPGLEVGGVAHAVVDSDITNSDILDVFEFAIVLADAAHCEAQTSVPVLVLDEDVGAVGLRGDIIVAAIDYPIAERDVVRVYDVGAIGIERREVEADLMLCICAVDIHVLKKDVLRVDDSHGPHLALYKAGLFNDTVFHALERDLMGTAGVVVGAVDEVVPNLTVAIECAVPEAIPVNVLATKDPSSRLILESNGCRESPHRHWSSQWCSSRDGRCRSRSS
jgi:hypothetical protein